MPPPPPRRISPINTSPHTTPPPPSKKNKINTKLYSYHGITQTNTSPNIQLQIVNNTLNNTLTIPSNPNPLQMSHARNTSRTNTLISNTNISALSSANIQSTISTLSNVPSHTTTLTETSNTLNTVYSDNGNSNYNISSSETSISIVTTENETSISDTINNAVTSPISPSNSDNRYNLIISPTSMDMTMESIESTHAKTLSYDGDIEPESDVDTVDNTITDPYTNCTYENHSENDTKLNSDSNSNNTDSESVETFILCDGDSNHENDTNNDISTYINDKIGGRNSNASNISNISSSSLLSVPNMNLSNIKLPNNQLSVTTQLSQLLDEQVKIITLTQTMDIKDVKPSDLPLKNIKEIYNGGLISVKSISVTLSPKPIDDIIEGFQYQIDASKLAINEIEKCLQINDNNMKYVD